MVRYCQTKVSFTQLGIWVKDTYLTQRKLFGRAKLEILEFYPVKLKFYRTIKLWC